MTVPQNRDERFPGYDVLSQAKHWDDKTRELVLDRVNHVPEISFFTAEEVQVLQPFVDVVMAQDEEPKIPVLNYIDEKYANGQRDGYRYFDLPDDDEVWRELAVDLRSARFDALGHGDQCGFIDGLVGSRRWEVIHRDILTAFYSHPWAWNEIGFGGPAYPRGYSRFGSRHLTDSDREAWEPREAFSRNPGQLREGLDG